jgi:hypothetical protein
VLIIELPGESPDVIASINLILHQLARVNKIEVSRSKEDAAQRLQMTMDLIRMGGELLLRQEPESLQSISFILAIIY